MEILTDENDWVTGMVIRKMELGEPDASGRRRPVEVPGSDYTIDVDTVIMSLGTSPNPLISSTTEGSGDEPLEMHHSGRGGRKDDEGRRIRRRRRSDRSSHGDPGMGAGKAAAKGIDEYLQKRNKKLPCQGEVTPGRAFFLFIH